MAKKKEKFVPEDNKLYFKKDLLTYLEQQGLPHTKPTLLRYERLGIIPSPRRRIEGFERAWRVYTGLQIKEISNILKEHIQ
jgi:hypothetical protein